MLKANRNRRVVLAILILYAVVSLSVNFFHTETTPWEKPDCPACHFLHVSLALTIVCFLFTAVRALLWTVTPRVLEHAFRTLLRSPLSRSPPSGFFI